MNGTTIPSGTIDWAVGVLAFWFEEVGERRWFAAGADLDATVDARFRELHGRIAAGLDTPRFDSATEVLAAVIVLDQFSRHIFRGTPRAYACDALARGLTRHAVASGLDVVLSPPQRMFLYMPLQHSEDPQDQSESVSLYATLGGEWYAHAVAHRDIIERFGRFPHRNEIVGRASTPAEVEAIAAGAAW